MTIKVNSVLDCCAIALAAATLWLAAEHFGDAPVALP
jgi:hypothetical protein